MADDQQQTTQASEESNQAPQNIQSGMSTGASPVGTGGGAQQGDGSAAQTDEQEADRRVQEFLKSTPPPEPRGSAYKHTEDFSTFATAVALPGHTTIFDEKYFLYLFAGSLVLSLPEKKEILGRIPQLSQFQIDELIKILEEEKQKFDLLENEHPEQIQKMRVETKRDWDILEMEIPKQAASENANNEAEEIRKKLGLA
ncbi:hypothetical protein COW46_02890 [Candidatus Gracilibacteria bacterium CG17_big_fil_post_rev_8_21_14_2_50_48_13]|nr:MAG: hypothetical protein COW46_02890 [Candidatus Gracilibacteria bacterium CG17_big_fil_post_rev_8_21_14_2_50_48_13]